MEKFICIRDFQNGDFAVGSVMTIEGWRDRALSWADSDGNIELYRALKKLPKKEVIEFIADIWQIEIISINDLDIENMFQLVLDIDYCTETLKDTARHSNNEHRREVLETIVKENNRIMEKLYKRGE